MIGESLPFFTLFDNFVPLCGIEADHRLQWPIQSVQTLGFQQVYIIEEQWIKSWLVYLLHRRLDVVFKHSQRVTI
jgi:hypothetical protein